MRKGPGDVQTATSALSSPPTQGREQAGCSPCWRVKVDIDSFNKLKITNECDSAPRQAVWLSKLSLSQQALQHCWFRGQGRQTNSQVERKGGEDSSGIKDKRQRRGAVRSWFQFSSLNGQVRVQAPVPVPGRLREQLSTGSYKPLASFSLFRIEETEGEKKAYLASLGQCRGEEAPESMGKNSTPKPSSREATKICTQG